MLAQVLNLNRSPSPARVAFASDTLLPQPLLAACATAYDGGGDAAMMGDPLLSPALAPDEALRRLPQEERDLRMQRLKRAMDLSMKHVYLDKDQQKKQTPFAWYVTPALEEVEAERDERAALGTGQPYNRQIP